MKRQDDNPAQLWLMAEVRPNGSGGFTVTPKKPTGEIDSKAAAKLLNVSRSQLSNIVNQPLAQKLLRWRWQSERQGKRLFELDSVLAYREASKDPEFGGLV